VSNKSFKPSFNFRSLATVLALICCLGLTGCLKHELSTGLTEREAQEMIVILKENSLDASRELVAREREEPSWTVFVRGGDQNLVLAWRVLQENGLPRQRLKGLDEVFSKEGMIPTATEERAKYLVGLSGEVSETLRAISGVVDARVNLVIPENSPLLERENWKPASASVLLKYRYEKPPLHEDSIKSLVSRAVEGLQTENITVVMQRVTPKVQPERDVQWYAASQEVTIAALGLLGMMTILAMVLLGRVKHLQLQVKQHQEAARKA
jgi:type III secretion protein J